MFNNKTFTVSEFMAYTSEDMKIVDKAIGHIRRNKRAYSQLVFIMAVFLFFGSQEIVVEAMTYGNVEVATTKITHIGELLYKIVITTANVTIGLGGILDITRNVKGGDSHGAIKTAFNYLTIGAVVNAMPFMIKLIAELFGGF